MCLWLGVFVNVCVFVTICDHVFVSQCVVSMCVCKHVCSCMCVCESECDAELWEAAALVLDSELQDPTPLAQHGGNKNSVWILPHLTTPNCAPSPRVWSSQSDLQD